MAYFTRVKIERREREIRYLDRESVGTNAHSHGSPKLHKEKFPEADGKKFVAKN